MKDNTRLPDEEVFIKTSFCQKCNGTVRAAVKHLMDAKSKRDFAKEVMNYDLGVKDVPLLIHRDKNEPFCECK